MRKRSFYLRTILICLLSGVCLAGCGGAAASEPGGGTLDIDYINGDGEITEEEVTAETDSGGMLGWLKEKLSSDKKSAGDQALSEMSGGEEQEESGLRQMYEQGSANGDQTGSNDGAGGGTAPEDAEDRSEGTKPQTNGQQGSQSGGQIPVPGDQSHSGGPSAPDGSQTKPEPAERKDTVSFTIRCDTAVNNGMHQESKWAGIVPADGCILPVTAVEFEEGDTVFDLLCDVRDTYKLHMSYRGSGGGEYIDGINNLYEFDGGRWSGWMYCVNGWYPNYGCGQYTVKSGDVIEWNYTCDLGLDLDAGMEGAREWKDTHE